MQLKKLFIRCGTTSFNCTAKAVTVPTANECANCNSTGYTLEHMVYIGNTLTKFESKSWAECSAECDKNYQCFAFAYNTLDKRCHLKRNSDGPSIFKTNFVHSRSCGTAGFGCENRECKSCDETGYTTELGYYAGGALQTLTQKTLEECAAACEEAVDCVATLYTSSNKYCYLKSTVTTGPSRSTGYLYQRR